MSSHSLPSPGDGSTEPTTPPVLATRFPPGELVVTGVIPAANVPRGPKLPIYTSDGPTLSVEERVDLIELVDADSPSCYFLRIAGESMPDAGLSGGDIVVADRALRPESGSVVVANIDGVLMIKRVVRRARSYGQPGSVVLLAADPESPPIECPNSQTHIVWGVVTSSMHDFMDRRSSPPADDVRYPSPVG